MIDGDQAALVMESKPGSSRQNDSSNLIRITPHLGSLEKNRIVPIGLSLTRSLLMGPRREMISKHLKTDQRTESANKCFGHFGESFERLPVQKEVFRGLTVENSSYRKASTQSNADTKAALPNSLTQSPKSFQQRISVVSNDFLFHGPGKRETVIQRSIETNRNDESTYPQGMPQNSLATQALFSLMCKRAQFNQSMQKDPSLKKNKRQQLDQKLHRQERHARFTEINHVNYRPDIQNDSNNTENSGNCSRRLSKRSQLKQNFPDYKNILKQNLLKYKAITEASKGSRIINYEVLSSSVHMKPLPTESRDVVNQSNEICEDLQEKPAYNICIKQDSHEIKIVITRCNEKEGE